MYGFHFEALYPFYMYVPYMSLSFYYPPTNENLNHNYFCNFTNAYYPCAAAAASHYLCCISRK